MKKMHASAGSYGSNEGTVLLIVLALTIILSGLGLLAVQHTRYELQSASNYYDGIQSGQVAEASQVLATMLLNAQHDYYYGALVQLQSDPTAHCGCPAGTLHMGNDRFSDIPAYSALPADGGTFEGVFGRMGVTSDMSACVFQPTDFAPPAGYSTDQASGEGFIFKMYKITSSGSFGEPEQSGTDKRYLRARGGVQSTVTIGPVESN